MAPGRDWTHQVGAADRAGSTNSSVRRRPTRSPGGSVNSAGGTALPPRSVRPSGSPHGRVGGSPPVLRVAGTLGPRRAISHIRGEKVRDGAGVLDRPADGDGRRVQPVEGDRPPRLLRSVAMTVSGSGRSRKVHPSGGPTSSAVFHRPSPQAERRHRDHHAGRR